MRMQKMPMPKVPAQGSITDKMRKQPMPVRPGPKQKPGGMAKPYKGGGVLDRRIPKRGPGVLGPKKKPAPGGILEKRNEKLKKAYGSSLNNMQMQKAGPVGPRNKKQAYGSALGGLKKADPKQKPGKLGKPRVTRPVQPRRRGSR